MRKGPRIQVPYDVARVCASVPLGLVGLKPNR